VRVLGEDDAMSTKGRKRTPQEIANWRASILASGGKRIKCLWSRSWMIDAVATHKTARAIARHVKCSHKTVLEAIERHGISMPVVPKTRKQTMRKRREAIELYRGGLTLRAIAAKIGDVDPTTIENWAREEGILRARGRSKRVSYNSELTEHGRARIAMIRRAVELHACEGLGRRRISRELGCPEVVVQKMLATPYADALRSFVFGPGQGARRERHARAMHEQGCNVELIARTIGEEVATVRTWL
jgi:transposase-like protein